jgi:hypothetical protein
MATPVQPGAPQRMPPPAPPPLKPITAGMAAYVREAFLFRWNVLFFAGGVAAAAMTPIAGGLLPLVAAAELTYLAGLISIRRFRAAVDAKVHQAGRTGEAAAPLAASPSLVTMLKGLPPDARARFERLHARCLEMRTIAAGVRGAAGDQAGSAEEIRTPGLDRLLWLFLRLLLSKTALDRFLQATNEIEIARRLEETRKSLAAAQGSPPGDKDERVIRSLQDSVANAELRIDNYGRAKKNGEFVTLELDRIEGKIQALAEIAVNRQDPDFISTQVDSAAESMRQTEKAVTELQHLTGMADQLEEPPAILESDLRGVLRQ